MTLVPSGVSAGGNFWCLLCIGNMCIRGVWTTVSPKNAKTSKHRFYSSVWIAAFWHFKRSGVSRTCIRVCVTLSSCISIEFSDLGSHLSVGPSDPRAESHFKHRRFQWGGIDTCNIYRHGASGRIPPGLPRRASFAASRLAPRCHVCGISQAVLYIAPAWSSAVEGEVSWARAPVQLQRASVPPLALTSPQ